MDVYIGLGSNLGDRMAHLRRGVRSLAARGLPPAALSGVWESAPVDCEGPERFLNMVARVETGREPSTILSELLSIERDAGRVRRRARNEPRRLDLDLLLAGSGRVELPDLVVPHPRMWGRRFVLAPLAEIAPSLRHPESGRTVADLERALRDEQPDVVWLGVLDGLRSSSRIPAGTVLDPGLSPNL